MLEHIPFPATKSADNNIKLHLQSSLADKAQQTSLEFYKNIKPKHIYTFAASETVSQLPPLRENFPLPIRTRISSGVSLGPFANGVQLMEEKKKNNKNTSLDKNCKKFMKSPESESISHCQQKHITKYIHILLNINISNIKWEAWIYQENNFQQTGFSHKTKNLLFFC